jgi:bifunctional N-acetylglucosamine-1-phosphate-uridyltransferase/glucosamine-1-phosphate-acetyltransferase GlmU-like protein
MAAARPLAALLCLHALAVPGPSTPIVLAAGHDAEDDRCVIEKGPGDLVSKDAPLVVPENAHAEDVVAVRGDVTVRRGAVVKKVVALGGSVRIETGATVEEDVIALGGDVRLAAGARVGKNAMALGGHLDARPGSLVQGSSLGFDLSIDGTDVKAKVLSELHLQDCAIEPASPGEKR